MSFTRAKPSLQVIPNRYHVYEIRFSNFMNFNQFNFVELASFGSTVSSNLFDNDLVSIQLNPPRAFAQNFTKVLQFSVLGSPWRVCIIDRNFKLDLPQYF